MTTDRKQMESELKRQCVALLKSHGFKGAFPNLYRDEDSFISLINFQFFSAGGSFCINLSYAEPNRDNVWFRKNTEAKKLRVAQTIEQIRLGAEPPNSDKWYSFGKTSYGEYRGNPVPVTDLAAMINHLIEVQAIPWWMGKREMKP